MITLGPSLTGTALFVRNVSRSLSVHSAQYAALKTPHQSILIRPVLETSWRRGPTPPFPWGAQENTIAGHSLRSGFATSATQAGKYDRQIMAQTGHQSTAMLSRLRAPRQPVHGKRGGEVILGSVLKKCRRRAGLCVAVCAAAMLAGCASEIDPGQVHYFRR
jgi:integrase